MNSEITSKNYDDNILKQGLQFQIDNYYEPKRNDLKRRIEIILGIINPAPEEIILDAGCGVGSFAYHTAKTGAVAFGFDYSMESIKAAYILTKKYGVGHTTKFVVADGASIPFKNDFFDKAICADFIEHISLEDKNKFLQELYRVLKPQGTAIIFTPNGIREKIGEIYWRTRHLLFGHSVPVEPLHFGVINKYQFESLLKQTDFSFRLIYEDVDRPCLSRLPLIRNILSLDLLWILRKK